MMKRKHQLKLQVSSSHMPDGLLTHLALWWLCTTSVHALFLSMCCVFPTRSHACFGSGHLLVQVVMPFDCTWMAFGSHVCMSVGLQRGRRIKCCNVTHYNTPVEMLKAKLAGEAKVAQCKPSSSLLTVCLIPPFAVGSSIRSEVAKPKGKATAANKKKTAAATKKPPVKKVPAKKLAAKQIQSDEEMSDADIEVSLGDEEQQHEVQGEPDLTQDEEEGASQAGKGRKGTKRAAANKPGTVKAGNAAGTNTHCHAN